jgi:hypothetical protein
MTDEEVMDCWRTKVGEVTALAEKSATDPVLLAGMDLPPARPGDGAEVQAAHILRACATQVLPKFFAWDVVSTIGGAAFVVLKQINEDELPPTA